MPTCNGASEGLQQPRLRQRGALRGRAGQPGSPGEAGQLRLLLLQPCRVLSMLCLVINCFILQYENRISDSSFTLTL